MGPSDSRPPISLRPTYNSTTLFTQIRTAHYEPEPSIIILTLYRPKNHNAFTNTMMLELERAYNMFDVDDRVKCIVFTGEGRIFCAGADLDVGFVGGRERVNEHRDGYDTQSYHSALPDLVEFGGSTQLDSEYNFREEHC